MVALKKSAKGLITQGEAAREIGQSERNIRRPLKKLKSKGDRAVVYGLRGRRTKRKLDEKFKEKAIKISSGKSMPISDRRWRRNIWATVMAS